MEIFWFVLGGLMVLFIWGLQSYISKNKLKISWLSWLGIVVGLFLSLFSIAWLVTSIREGESRAAGMGLLIFGGLALIILTLTRRKIIKNSRLKMSSTKKNKP